MTRRARLSSIPLAALAALSIASCTDADTNVNPADSPSASDATLSGVVFDVHRDPG
jgi:hypothetical protein